MKKTKKVVKAWAYFNTYSGKIGVFYRPYDDLTGGSEKVPVICRTRAEARRRGCDKPHWKIVPVEIHLLGEGKRAKQ